MRPPLRRAALAAALLALGAARAAELSAAQAQAAGPPRYPEAGPVWLASFERLGVPIPSPAAAAPLASALAASGFDPARLEGLAPAEREQRIAAARSGLHRTLEPWAVSTLAAASGLRPADLRGEELREAAERFRYLSEALGPYLSAPSARRVRAVYEPLRRAAEAAEKRRQRDLVLRTAEALGSSSADGSAVAGGEGSGAPRLSRRPAGPRERRSRLAAFSDLARSVFRGQAPAMAADMDETLTESRAVMSPEMTAALAAYLRAGGRFTLLSGSSFDAVRKQVLNPLLDELAGDEKALGRLVVAPRSGSQTYRYARGSRAFELTRIVDLDAVLISRGVLDGPAKVRAVLDETARRFDFEGTMRRLLGKGVQGPLIVEDRRGPEGPALLTQITLVPTGAGVSEPDKRAYDAGEGRERRREYAAFINRRFRELGLPLEARVAGKTSIDIGIDKGFGLQAASQEMKAEPASVVWAGDSHEDDGNDAPAARLAAAVVHVGPRLDAPPGRRTFAEDGAGPEGLLPYLEELAGYASSVSPKSP